MTYFITTFYNEMFQNTFGTLDSPHCFLPLEPNREDNQVARKIVHILWHFNIFIHWSFFFPDYYKKLDAIKSNDVVIFYIFFPEPLFNLVPRFKKRGIKMTIWLWDSLSTTPILKENINHVKALNVPIYTFDYNDSKNYKLGWIPQFYNFHKIKQFHHESNGIYWDCYFLGNPKDELRKNSLNYLKSVFEKYNISYNFHIPDGKQCKYIGYDQNLENICRSKCIVELNVEGQSGLTLRSMEALAYKRKLITNNKYIKDYQFYNSNNIFIIGEDDENSLSSFLNGEYIDIPNNVLSQFDVNAWYKRLIAND